MLEDIIKKINNSITKEPTMLSAAAASSPPEPVQLAQIADVVTLNSNIMTRAWIMRGPGSGDCFESLKPTDPRAKDFYGQYMRDSNKWIVLDGDFKASFSEQNDPTHYPHHVALMSLGKDEASVDVDGPLIFINLFGEQFRYAKAGTIGVNDAKSVIAYKEIYVGSRNDLILQLGNSSGLGIEASAKAFLSNMLREVALEAAEEQRILGEFIQTVASVIVPTVTISPDSPVEKFAQTTGGDSQQLRQNLTNAAHSLVVKNLTSLINRQREQAPLLPYIVRRPSASAIVTASA